MFHKIGPRSIYKTNVLGFIHNTSFSWQITNRPNNSVCLCQAFQAKFSILGPFISYEEKEAIRAVFTTLYFLRNYPNKQECSVLHTLGWKGFQVTNTLAY
jgi:hypothetical protein